MATTRRRGKKASIASLRSLIQNLLSLDSSAVNSPKQQRRNLEDIIEILIAEAQAQGLNYDQAYQAALDSHELAQQAAQIDEE